jgi:hypothetical protein
VEPRDAATRWSRTWADAWPQLDAAPIAALYADEHVYRALAFRPPTTALLYLANVFAEETDVSCRFGDPIVDGERAAVEWWASWVENDRRLTLAGTTILRFDARGLVVDQRDYWNEADGAVQPYEGW